MLHNRRDGECGWWLDQEAPAPIWNVVAGAARTNLPIPQVIGRLHSLGFEVPEIPHLSEFLALLSRRNGDYLRLLIQEVAVEVEAVEAV
jgi:hypothetical protein